jgi:hypothetical protein
LKTIGILAIAAIAALVLGLGSLSGTKTAHADANDIQLIGCELIADAADGTIDGVSDYDAAGCDGTGPTPAVLLFLDEIYGDDDGELEPEDLADRELLDGNQIGEDCTSVGVAPAYGAQCVLIALVYVDDEAAVTIDPPAGLQTTEAGTIDFVCDTEGEDADCADTVPNDGDGVVVFHILNDTADAGATLEVNAEQETEEVSADVNVVGTPDDVTIALVEEVIQASGTTSDVTDCVDDFDVEEDLGEPNATIAVVEVVDNDGEPLARETALIESDDEDIAVVGEGTPDEAVGNTGQTVVVDAGTAQYAIICGGTDTGTVDITATIAGDEEATAELTVVGEPDAIALSAAPATIACDGTATSTVTATVTDADGNNVANGTPVQFSVVALGTANPINTTTTDGVATSVITPLSNASAGVTVVVTAGEDDNAQSSIRVDCSLPIPSQPTTPAGQPTPGGGVRPPDTGTGGYVGQDGAGFPMWTLIALGLGSMALVAGGLVTRKVSK